MRACDPPTSQLEYDLLAQITEMQSPRQLLQRNIVSQKGAGEGEVTVISTVPHDNVERLRIQQVVGTKKLATRLSHRGRRSILRCSSNSASQ